MNLLIHDLCQSEWEKISADYDGWQIVDARKAGTPCSGCFGCWNRTPGQCVIKDGYENMGYLIHHADEVHIISRYAYGGFSSAVKSVIDRCLGYVLPHFELVNGETHHKKRYDEDKPITFIFYGQDLNDEQKAAAERYVRAVCTNMRTHVRKVVFRKGESLPKPEITDSEYPGEKTVLLNASMRFAKGNSAKLAEVLREKLNGETETVNLVRHLNDLDGLINSLRDADTLVLCTPLYVDGLPAQLIRLMEKMQEKYEAAPKRVYVLANMGLFEPRQLANLLEAVRQWCAEMGFRYGGALAVGAGELVGGLLEFRKPENWPLAPVGKGLSRLAEAINAHRDTEDIYAGTDGFPRWLYMAIANSGWKRMARANGITNRDLFRRL